MKNNYFITLMGKLFLWLLFIAIALAAFFLLFYQETLFANLKVPFVKPADGEIITGFRQEYLDESEQVTRQHTGIDILGDIGGKVMASGNGTVIYTGFSPIGGRTIVIRHNEKIRTTYLNISENFVIPGDRILQGDVIASIGAGDDPSSLLPHLHFGIIYNGFYLDPEDVLNIDYSIITKYITLQYIKPDFDIKADH